MMKSSPRFFDLCLKLFIISLLASFSYPAAAEFYMVTATDSFEPCYACAKPRQVHHRRHKKIAQHRHHYYSRTGLFVYYPISCVCCTTTKPRMVGDDYVTFNNNPTWEPKNWHQKAEYRYSQDLSTGDDVTPDMERD